MKKNKNSLTNKSFLIFSYIVLFILAVMMLGPLLSLLNLSFKSDSEFYADPMAIAQIKSLSEMFANYRTAFEKLDVISRFFRTVIICLSAAVIHVLIIILAGYPLSRGHIKHTNAVYTFILASMFFPGSLLATIFLIEMLGLYNSPLSLVCLWSFGGIAMHIFMIFNFVKSVPKELDEAAFIDGCSYFKVIIVIVLPLLTPIMATIFMLKFINCWNDFMTPYIFLVTNDLMTLSTGLFLFKGQYSNNWPLLAASTVIVALPMTILYIFLQKFIISGMTAGALKG